MSSIRDALEAADSHVTEWPTGRKLPKPPTSMEMWGYCAGPASSVPDTSTPVGTIEGWKIAAPPDDPDRERPRIWSEPPSWMTSGERWRRTTRSLTLDHPHAPARPADAARPPAPAGAPPARTADPPSARGRSRQRPESPRRARRRPRTRGAGQAGEDDPPPLPRRRDPHPLKVPRCTHPNTSAGPAHGRGWGSVPSAARPMLPRNTADPRGKHKMRGGNAAPQASRRKDAPAVSSPHKYYGAKPLTRTFARNTVCVKHHFLRAEPVDTPALAFLSLNG